MLVLLMTVSAMLVGGSGIPTQEGGLTNEIWKRVDICITTRVWWPDNGEGKKGYISHKSQAGIVII